MSFAQLLRRAAQTNSRRKVMPFEAQLARTSLFHSPLILHQSRAFARQQFYQIINVSAFGLKNC